MVYWAEEMEYAINAWMQRRNNDRLGANWHFKTDNARVKLKRLYRIQTDE